MGNSPSRKSRKNKDDVASRAQKVAADFQAGIQNGIKKLEENDHPAAQLIDSVCGPYLDPDMHRQHRNRSYDESSSDEESDLSEDETTATDYDKRRRQRRKQKQQQQQQDEETLESASYLSQSDYESAAPSRQKSAATDESSQEPPTHAPAASSSKQQTPLASSFAKRCYFTKAGIGKTVQHYEGLTLTGNVVLMLANAMKLKGCPTICDEDLRRVEQTYPNQFSRLPDELLLSSGWRRISKYCHFSNKPIPDGVPFFREYEQLRCTEWDVKAFVCVCVCVSQN